MRIFPEEKKYRPRAVGCIEGNTMIRFLSVAEIGVWLPAANGNLYPCYQLSLTYDANSQFLANVKEDGLKKYLRKRKINIPANL